MNKLNMFKTIAASALVLSTIASPAAFAAPEKGEMAIKSSIVSTVAIESKDQASVLVNIWSDPLSLAKKYAPETAKEWEQVLAKYNKQFGRNEGVSLTLNTEGVIADSALSVTIDSNELKSGLTTVLPSIALEELKGAQAIKGDLKVVKLNKPDNVSLPVETSVENNTNLASVTLLKTSDKLIQAQIELDKAVQTESDKQIKTALVKLLTAYKAELNK